MTAVGSRGRARRQPVEAVLAERAASRPVSCAWRRTSVKPSASVSSCEPRACQPSPSRPARAPGCRASRRSGAAAPGLQSGRGSRPAPRPRRTHRDAELRGARRSAGCRSARRGVARGPRTARLGRANSSRPPARPDASDHSAVREDVERGERLGHLERLTHGQHEHARAERHALGCARPARPAVVNASRKPSSGAKGARPRGRDTCWSDQRVDDVVGNPDRVEPGRPRRARATDSTPPASRPGPTAARGRRPSCRGDRLCHAAEARPGRRYSAGSLPPGRARRPALRHSRNCKVDSQRSSAVRPAPDGVLHADADVEPSAAAAVTR